jgi:hypothetical protein
VNLIIDLSPVCHKFPCILGWKLSPYFCGVSYDLPSSSETLQRQATNQLRRMSPDFWLAKLVDEPINHQKYSPPF